jgi:SAM-dependent methyltransferase
VLVYLGDQSLAPHDAGLRVSGGGHSVFVGGPGGRFVPGGYIDQLVAAHENGSLRGAAGLWFDHAAVVGVNSATRGALATLLRHFFADRSIFVMDELSVEWAAHYGLTARLGGHPAWLAPSGARPSIGFNDLRVRDEKRLDEAAFSVVCGTVEEAFNAAVRGFPMLLLPKADGGPGCASQDSYAPLRRWAATYGALDMLCASGAEAAERVPTAQPFSRERLEVERARARETFEELLAPPAPPPLARCEALFEPATEADGVLAAALARALGGPRIVEPGMVFDPRTHYDENYYAGPEGHGIRYMQPNGTWTTYHGPARVWDGNKVIAGVLNKLLPRASEHSLLDIGCGAGDFVNQMYARGWDARGIDISDAATRGNPRVVCGDFAAGGIAPGWSVVTALDFWEHIFERDLDRLIDATAALLAPGGLHVAVICTRSAAEQDFVAEPGVRFTRENSWLLVSGHVNIRDWTWWAKKFREHGFKLRCGLAYLFQVMRNEDPGLSLVKSWQAKNMLVLERR